MAYIFEASFRTVVTWVSKKSSFDQSGLEILLVSDCKTNYMIIISIGLEQGVWPRLRRFAK